MPSWPALRWPPMDLRRLVSRALVGGLCVSGAVAVIALLSGSFDEIHWRVVGTSLGFSIFTCTAAAGVSLRTLTSTHPTLEQRLEQLAKIRAELDRTG